MPSEQRSSGDILFDKAMWFQKPPQMEKISDALQSIPTMKEELHRAFQVLQSSAPSSFNLQWSSIDSHISSIQTSLQTQFQQLQSDHPSPPLSQQQPPQYVPPPFSQVELESDWQRVLKSLCINSDENGLSKFIRSFKHPPKTNRKIGKLLVCASDPAKLVLNSLQRVFLRPVTLSIASRKTSLGLLQAVSVFGCVIQAEMKQEAKKLAAECKKKAYVELYMQVLITFGMKDKHNVDDWVEMLVSRAQKQFSVDMCRELGLVNKVPGIIKTLISKKKQIDAIKFVYAFKLVDMFPPVPLLEAYLKESRKATKEILDKRDWSLRARHKAFIQESSSLRSVILCMDKYKFGSQIWREKIVKRIKELREKTPSKKFHEAKPQRKGKNKCPQSASSNSANPRASNCF